MGTVRQHSTNSSNLVTLILRVTLTESPRKNVRMLNREHMELRHLNELARGRDKQLAP
jgi:hypothetical protein